MSDLQFNKMQHNTNYFNIIKYHAHLYRIYIVHEHTRFVQYL